MSGDRYRMYDQNALYFITCTIVDWIDVFTRAEYRSEIVDSLAYCQRKKGLILYAWCIMSNHLYLIAQAREGYDISHILRDFKKFTARRILDKIQNEPESRKDWILDRFAFRGKYDKRIKRYKFWKESNHALLLDSNYLMEQKLEYIHQNPVKALWVEEPEHYLFSSARNYAGLRGLLDVAYIV